jgi:hypothetical protein
MNVNAQIRYVDVAPGLGTLNEAINSDTTDLGERIDPENTVYRLQRGNEAYYLLEGSIENRFPLVIEAAEGDGARPFLQPAVVGEEASRAFRARDNITLRGLHVTNYDNAGGQPTRIIRASAEGITILVEDCWFDRDGQSFIRCDDPDMTIKIKNCVVSNIGYPSSPDNGRGIDDRGNNIDTVIIENSTFYNISSRIIRDGGGYIKYAKVNNNTFVNLGQHGISFGPVGMLEVKDNLFMNAAFIPQDEEDGRYVLSVDSLNGAIPDVTQSVIVQNNSFYVDTTAIEGYLNDTLSQVPLFNETMLAFMEESGDVNTVLNLMVDFEDGPPINTTMIDYITNPDLNLEDAPFWDLPEIPAGGNDIYYLDVPYDFGYVNSKAFVAATDFMQLGDRSWTADRGVMGLVDFEAPNDEFFWFPFGNAGDAPENLNVIPNPDKSGINTSDHVMEYIVLDGAQSWAGAFSDAYGKMEFTEEKHYLEMMVWKDKISNCAMKVEMGGTVTEVKVPNTKTGEWELIQFDFSANIGETLTRLVVFPDFPDSRTEGGTVYLDNFQIVEGPGTVVDIIVNSEDHTTLETAVVAAELDGVLSGEGPFTVFAPTDAAFDALPEGTLDDLLADPTGALANVLKYHVVAAKALSSDLSDGQTITTLQGDDLTVTINGDGVFINDAQVTAPDIMASNGVVHVVNGVLIPPVNVEDKSAFKLKLYPNPVENQMIVQYPEMNQVVVRNILGEAVRTIKLSGVDQTIIQTADLADGVYFITVANEGNSVTTKFVKK